MSLRLPPTSAPISSTRLMVFAPHCDDETLGCGGLIRQTIEAKGEVRTVIFTNGDSFRTAVECQTHTLHISAQDFIDFGKSRQQESLDALSKLGVPGNHVTFLGYPDQGLLALWNDHWTLDTPYTSRTTGCKCSPYATVATPNTPYCGASVLRDVKACLRAFKPTLVTVTHPADEHGDHSTAAAFVALALQQLMTDPGEREWASHTRIQYYLIHRGNWPPLSLRDDATLNPAPLMPPAEMLRTDSRWTSLSLTPQQCEAKLKSVALYPSQTTMMGHFLHAFLRPNELYAELPFSSPSMKLPTVKDGSIHIKFDTQADTQANTDTFIDGNIEDWRAVTPVLVDPIRDNLLRDLNGAGDLQALYACRDRTFLYLRLDCRETVSRAVRYTIYLRTFTNDHRTSTKAMQIDLPVVGREGRTLNGIGFASSGHTLEAAIPWKILHQPLQRCFTSRADNNNRIDKKRIDKKRIDQSHWISEIAISAETWAGVVIDKSGVRLLEVNN